MGRGGHPQKQPLKKTNISLTFPKKDFFQSRQMGFRKAADFFQVSKWKLYKTARKRGIYAEIKKQNQAHVS